MSRPDAVVLRFPNWIGDAAMALPALEAARGQWPTARLGVIVHDRARPLLAGHRAIDRLHAVPATAGRWSGAIAELRSCRYDLGLLLAHSFSSALLLALAGVPGRIGRRGDGRDWLLTRRLPPADHATPMPRQFLELVEAAGYRGAQPPMSWRPSREDHERAGRWLGARDLAGRPLVAMAPGAAHGPSKRWPPERFGAVAARLARDHGVTVLVFGAPVERPIVEAVLAAAGPDAAAVLDLDLRAAAALLTRCRLLLANDSGLLHVARAAGVPVVGLYGSTTPDWSGPTPAEGEAIYLRLDCSPCFDRECRRPDRSNACLSELTVEAVIPAVERVLARPLLEAAR